MKKISTAQAVRNQRYKSISCGKSQGAETSANSLSKQSDTCAQKS